jgi:hypothetical protein
VESTSAAGGKVSWEVEATAEPRIPMRRRFGICGSARASPWPDVRHVCFSLFVLTTVDRKKTNVEFRLQMFVPRRTAILQSFFILHFAMSPLTGSDSQYADTPIVLCSPKLAMCISPASPSRTRLITLKFNHDNALAGCLEVAPFRQGQPETKSCPCPRHLPPDSR